MSNAVFIKKKVDPFHSMLSRKGNNTVTNNLFPGVEERRKLLAEV